MEETSAAVNNQLTLTSPPLPTLPFELIQEILCRLPVKLLLQLRCVCKPWNSLISDHKFITKHLSLSTTRHLSATRHVHSCNHILMSYPLDSVFTNDLTTNVSQHTYPSTNFDKLDIVGSCNGIICIANFNKTSAILWNPSIRTFKELPPIQEAKVIGGIDQSFGFGYDSCTDNYKVVAISHDIDFGVNKVEVMVHTLGTNFWKSIQECPFGVVSTREYGKFVSGRINWLASIDFQQQSPCFIVSFDLGKESYQKVLPPDHGGVGVCNLTLSVLRDCLCIISGNDIWVMKEYGIQESWNKLFTVPNMPDPNGKYYILTKPVYVFQDDQVLLECVDGCNRNQYFFVYDSKNGTFRFTRFRNITLEVYVESFISPCF